MIQTELIKRTATAIILAPLFILAVYKLPSQYFNLLLLVLTLIAAYEWLGLAKLDKTYQKVAFAVGFCITLIGTIYLLLLGPLNIILVMLVSLVFWLFNVVFVILYPKAQGFWYGSWLIRAANGILLLVPMLIGLIFIHAADKNLFMLILTLVWAADSGAYFAGKVFGKRKLSPNISPNKTIEGVVGGILLSMFVMFLWTLITNKDFTIAHMIITVVLVFFTIIGDLYESLFKRVSGLKDSGKFLPGHGGILDRIDGIVAAVPVYIVIILVIAL